MSKIFNPLLILLLFASCKNKDDSQNDQDLPKTQTSPVTINIDTLSKQIAPSIDSLVKQFEDPQRVDWQNPELVIDILGDLSNKIVADIGAGSGYFTFRLVNDAKKIIAIDIETEFLDLINGRKSGMNEVISNKIETRLVAADEPGLLEKEVDLILLVNTYLNIENRTAYARKLYEGLADNGKLVIIDYKTGDLPAGPPDSSKVSTKIAKSELLAGGFTQIEIDTLSLNYQYIITAK